MRPILCGKKRRKVKPKFKLPDKPILSDDTVEYTWEEYERIFHNKK